MLLSASYSTATAGFDTAVCDICATSSSEFEAPRDQLPELVVPSEAEEPRDVRSCERDTELPVADLVAWTVVAPVADEASDVVAFILLKLKAAAAAPANATMEPEAMNRDLRRAARADSRIARRVSGATSSSFAASAGSRPSVCSAPSARMARTPRTACAAWEPRGDGASTSATRK